MQSAKRLFDRAMRDAWYFYGRLLEYGLKPEDARFVLPNACTTTITVSGNFREWRNFLQLRLSPRAQWEIRKLANIILDKLYEIAPSCFEDLKDRTTVQQT
jgi:thymidylate synthase (FAD)